MGTKTVRITKLPPEVTYAPVCTVLAPYVTILSITDEIWSPQYRYEVYSGVRRVSIQLTKHIPFQLTVTGHRVQLSYVGQPATCFSCGGTDHLYNTYPSRPFRGLANREHRQTTYANIVSARDGKTQSMGDGHSDEFTDNYLIHGNARAEFKQSEPPQLVEGTQGDKPFATVSVEGPNMWRNRATEGGRKSNAAHSETKQHRRQEPLSTRDSGRHQMEGWQACKRFNLRYWSWYMPTRRKYRRAVFGNPKWPSNGDWWHQSRCA
jgi:hypothetical protein